MPETVMVEYIGVDGVSRRGILQGDFFVYQRREKGEWCTEYKASCGIQYELARALDLERRMAAAMREEIAALRACGGGEEQAAFDFGLPAEEEVAP